MSRIGKKAIAIPSGVKVTPQDRTVSVEGPKGSLSIDLRPEVNVEVEDGHVRCTVGEGAEAHREVRAYWGMTRALINNMIEGCHKGYEKNMEIVGVGWGAQVQGKQLKIQVGYAQPVMMDIPDGLEVTAEKQNVKIVGPDKQAVGQFAAAMRAKRKPEPYNGKGIKYADEVIRKKQGKAFGN